MAAPAARPTWLIFGGTGFYGRSLVKYLLDNGLASAIRVADKKTPLTAFLAPPHKAALMNPIVDYQQVDVSDEEHVERAFSAPHPAASVDRWDYVINFAAETALDKSDEFLDKGVAGARGAAVKTAGPMKGAACEDAKLGPWTRPSAACARAEEEVRRAAGALPYVILRPALTYGPGDMAGLMSRCVIAATYKTSGEVMKFLWDGDLKCSTVHVFDVARAVYFAARKCPPGVFNLSDSGATDQARIARVMAEVFGIETGFVGSMKSTLASTAMDTVVESVNDKHLSPWTALLKAHGIKNTPLTPFIHRDLLGHNHLHIDGTAIEAVGFKYAVPELNADAVREMLALAIAQGIFPPVVPGIAVATSAAAAK